MFEDLSIEQISSLRLLPHCVTFWTFGVITPLTLICVQLYLYLSTRTDNNFIVNIICAFSGFLIIIMISMNKIFDSSTEGRKFDIDTSDFNYFRRLSTDSSHEPIKTKNNAIQKTTLSESTKNPFVKREKTSLTFYVTNPKSRPFIFWINNWTYKLGITQKNYTMMTSDYLNRFTKPEIIYM
jgi:hypothetical protein